MVIDDHNDNDMKTSVQKFSTIIKKYIYSQLIWLIIK